MSIPRALLMCDHTSHPPFFSAHPFLFLLCILWCRLPGVYFSEPWSTPFHFICGGVYFWNCPRCFLVQAAGVFFMYFSGFPCVLFWWVLPGSFLCTRLVSWSTPPTPFAVVYTFGTARGLSWCRLPGSFLCIFRGSPVFYFGGGCRGLFYVPAWYHAAHASTPFVVVYTFGTARGVSCCRLPGSFLLISLVTPVLFF